MASRRKSVSKRRDSFKWPVGTRFHMRYNCGRTGRRTSSTKHHRTPHVQREESKSKKGKKEMAQKQWPVGVENKKDRFTRPFELVEITRVELVTFSMPLACREQVK